MKQHFLKSGLTILLCMGALLSCSTEPTTEVPGETSDLSSQTNQTAETEPILTSGNPDDLDLGGEVIRLWYTTDWPSYTDLPGEQSGDIVDEAVYSQNLAVQERLNCTIDFVDSGVYQGECNKAISTLLLANDTTFDIYCATQWNGVILISQGLYLNINDMPYLSLHEPWWDLAYMEQTSMGTDRIYTLVGDCIIDRLRYLSCVYYNKQMYRDLFGDADGLYQTVLDGEWTYETLKTISETVFSDINNNGKTDEEDTIGARLCWNQDIMALQYCTGVPLTARDEDNIPYLVANSEKMADVARDLYTLSYETNGIIYGDKKEAEEIELATKQFTEDKSMFLFGQLQTSESLRDMKTDFGVIPTPKYDAEQKNYYSYMFEAMRLMALPYNCQKPETVCAVLEELAFEGYTAVSPVYYGTVLKNKYARDDISSQMIDMVRNGLHTDIALVHVTEWNVLSCYVRYLLQKKSYDFASYYEKMEKVTVSSGEKFIANFLENT